MRLLRTLIGYGCATYLTLVLVLAGFGLGAPRAGDATLLAQAGLPAAAVLVGMKSVSHQTPAGFRTAESRYYLVLPRSLAERTAWVVSRGEDGTSQVATSAPAFWWVIGMLLLSLLGLTWFLRSGHGTADEATAPGLPMRSP